ncbi:MAG: OmpA family protein [Candidatus Kapaibacterium sp.]|nr:OmpA family protein [Ignavibacteriota bacterium]MCB9220908.1 OmpA family protein [Ignavibacteria bacterium]
MMKLKYIILATVAFLLFSNDLQSQGFIKTVVSLTGNVFNQVTKQPETTALLVMKDGKRVTATRSRASENGYYYITGLKAGESYDIKLQKSGFMDQQFSIQVPNTDKYAEISKDFLIMPKEVGVKLPLSVPPFEYNKSKLRVGSEILLDDLQETLKLNPDVKVQIISYPDNDKSPAANETLTKDRAESLKKFFANSGVSPERMSIMANKTTDPDNPPPKEKAAKGKRYIGKSYIKIVSL